MKLKIGDIFVIITSLLIALAIWLCFIFSKTNSDSLTAVISVDGKIEKKILLPSDKSEFEYNGVKVVIDGDLAYIESSDCPDKTCVKTGKISDAGQRSICLPNRVMLYIEGDNSPDATIG